MTKIQIISLILISSTMAQAANYVTPAWPNQTAGTKSTSDTFGNNKFTGDNLTLPGDTSWNGSSSSSSSYGSTPAPASGNQFSLPGDQNWNAAPPSSSD